MFAEKRIGKFEIHYDCYVEDIEVVKSVLSQVVVVKAELLMATKAIEYIAYSDLFKPVAEYDCPNLYEPIVGYSEELDRIIFQEFQMIGGKQL